jgi:hypothetical protein
MPFEKGQIKRGGRKKGTPNKVTTEIRSKIEDILHEQTDTIKEDLMKLSPKDRVRAYTELLKYVIPTRRDVEVTDNTPDSLQKFLELNDDDIKRRIQFD